MYFLKHKSDAASAFRSFLASVRADGKPSSVEIVRSDNGGEFFHEEFESLCNELLIEQELTPAYSPQYNGVAERGLGVIEAAAMAARIQAIVLFDYVQLPKTDKLWAEAMPWACEALNHTACSANPDSKSPYEMLFGETFPTRPYPFLNPAYCRWQRPSKMLPKGESCFYVGPSRDHPRDCHRVLTRAGTIQETRDVTWEAPPSRFPPPQPPLPIEVAEEGGEESDGDAEAEVWPLEGRGIPHVRLQRRTNVVDLSEAADDPGSAGGVDAGSNDLESAGVAGDEGVVVGDSHDVEQPPSSPLSISGPPLEVGSPSPETVEQELGGQESGSREPGGQALGDDQQELPPAARSALRQLAAHNTPAHDNDEVRAGRTRARTRAEAQQGASVLFATLGPFAGTEMVEALISEQRASDEGELPKELVQDVESEPASFQEACSSKHALIWDKAMSAEFEGLLGAGTFALAAKTPEGCNVIDARWVYK